MTDPRIDERPWILGRIQRHWPLVGALGLLAFIVAALLWRQLRVNDGHLTYALDDAYIHLAIAKNLAHHGVWGVTRYSFAPASSSLLWPLLLAPLAAHESAPLLLNLISAAALLTLTYWLLYRRASPRLTFLTLVGMLLLVPIPALIFSGMEHLLHAWVAVALVHVAARQYEHPPGVRSNGSIALLIFLAFVAVAIRYESLFLVAPIAAGFAIGKRRLRLGAALALFALLPIVVFGLYSIRHGGKFLPNSLLVKGRLPHLSPASIGTFIFDAAMLLLRNPHVLLLFVAVPALLMRGRRHSPGTRLALVVLLVAALAHLAFADFGWFFRYEAYLVAIWISVSAIALAEEGLHLGRLMPPGEPRLWGALLLLFALFPLLLRGANALFRTVPATRDIYRQQQQMARFVARYYPEDHVAANDIGAICYRSDIHLLDLYGLASLPVLDAKRRQVFDTGRIDALTREAKVKIALVYDDWFTRFGGLPTSWRKVGQWKVPGSVILGADIVSFYAVDPAEAPRLAEHLREFAPELPSAVEARTASP